MVEIGLTRTGIEGTKGLNFISTGHEKRAEPGLSYLYDGQLKYGYTIRETIHSHPITNKASKADLEVQNWITNRQKNQDYLFQSFQFIMFQIKHIYLLINS